MKAFCTQFTDRECREEDCCLLELTESCLLELAERIDKIRHVSKCLNVIINPVERWFHYVKPLPIEMPRDVIMHTMKDHDGNDVLCWLGMATFKCDIMIGESGGF